MEYPISLEKLVESLERLPGVGHKTALRYGLYIINNFSSSEIIDLANSLINVKDKIRHCKECGMLTEDEICSICSSDKRDKKKILVVEEIKDVIAIEKTEKYNGLYHVLGGSISPLNGIGPEDINIASLLTRLENVDEVIIATGASVEGEATALYLKRILGALDLNVTRIAYGMPAGSSLEYTDEVTIWKALEGRRKM